MNVDIALVMLPHYRAGLVRELASDKRVNIRWLVGDRSSSGIPVVSLDGLASVRLRNRKCTKDLIWQGGLLSTIRKSRPRVLVLTGDPRNVSTWFAMLLCRAVGVKTLLWTHGWTRQDRGVKKFVRSAFYRLSDGLVLYGHRGYNLGLEHDYPKPMHVIYNSVDIEVVDPKSRDASNRRSGECQRWVIVSRLNPNKGFGRVLDAMKVLNDQGRKVQLTVVGTGPELESLRSHARRLRVDVDFLGAVFDQERVNSVIDASDILVSPLNVGLSAMHSMARGCPVATSAIEAEQMPEAEAVRDGETGVRFDPYSVESMARSIWEFVEMSDPETVGNACVSEIHTRWNASSQSERLIAAVLATGMP